MSKIDDVVKFNQLMGVEKFEDISLLNSEVLLGLNLIKEELKELEDAILAEDRVEQLDACGDLLYVVYGMVYKLGFDSVLTKAFKRIHESNLSKTASTFNIAKLTVQKYKKEGVDTYIENRKDMYIIKRTSDNKVLKSIDYKPVDLKDLV